MKMIKMGILTLLFGLVEANLLLNAPFHGATSVKRYFPEFLLCSRYVGYSSVFIRGCIGQLHAIRCYIGLDSVLNRFWIGVRSADICPIGNRSKTNKPSTISGQIKTDSSPNAPQQNRHHTDIKPTDNRQFVREKSFKHVWKISPRQICVPEHKPTPNWQNRINTDCKPISPRIWWFLSVWCRFCVGLAGVTGVWLLSLIVM